MAVTAQAFNDAASMQELYDLLARCKIENGWNKPEPSLYALPKKEFLPAHFTWSIGRAALDAAGRFVNTEHAERRNLILANPVSKYPTVKTLVAAYQMVKGGEVARSHRHTANALRLVLDTGERAYTIVEGKKIPMEPGDVLLTPNWYWHGHSNEGPANAYWMDFLDVPTVHMLGPMFFEHHPDDVERADEIAAQSPCRFPWSETVARLRDAPEVSPGRREIELGAPALATIALHVTRLDAGASFTVAPSTLNCIYAPMKGEGEALIDGAAFAWSRGDALAVPSSSPHTWTAREESYLLRVSDKPLLERLDWLRPVPAR
ncbi:MAG: cupin domain-containing protein [Beijerinckiaceae bacterium]|nr:cupin domain-containing protein [Beijerinckiaceae bacterium]